MHVHGGHQTCIEIDGLEATKKRRVQLPDRDVNQSDKAERFRSSAELVCCLPRGYSGDGTPINCPSSRWGCRRS